MSWGSDSLGITQETFEMVKSATSGITPSTGLFGLKIDELVSLVPVDVPFFNSVPRTQAAMGAQFAFWEALLNINNQQSDVGVQPGYAAALAQIQNQYMYAPFSPVGMGFTVNWDSQAGAENYADALAVGTLQAINQLLIGMDQHMLVSQSFALPAAPTPTLVASATGGSIATSTVYVKVAARSGLNYFHGGSQTAGTAASASVVSGGSTGSVAASCTAVKTACAYDWWTSSDGTTYHYNTTTAANAVTLTSVPTTNANVPTNLAGLYNAGVQMAGTIPVADASFQTYWENGLLGSILGDYAASLNQLGGSSFSAANLVTPGSGTTQGAYYKSLDGSQMTVAGAALNEIDAMNRSIYDTYRVTPTRMLVGSQVINDIANALLDNPQAVTWLVPTDQDGRARLVAGGAVAVYLNKTVNGKPIMIELMPNLPPGKIISVVDQVPFPGANISTALEERTLYDFYRFDYGANRVASTANGGPRFDFEIRSQQTLLNKASQLMGVLDSIGAGIS